jgi:molybdopterin-biosynthesis enzyme MoeA-like protein
MKFGAIIIGDEILSGKRADKHLAKTIELLGARGISLAYAHYVGDDPQRITETLSTAFASGDVVFSFGGIGATPDDHTRQCAALACGSALTLSAEAQALIQERIRDVAAEQNMPYEPERPDNLHRLQMGMFPQGASIIPNPYNKIPGFSYPGAGQGRVFFVPGFPVMAWPMVEWALDTYCSPWFHHTRWREQSVIVLGAMESLLTPLMEQLEKNHPVKVFSLPSVDHPQYGKHIELGVKGDPGGLDRAYAELLAGLKTLGVELGPELVR